MARITIADLLVLLLSIIVIVLLSIGLWKPNLDAREIEIMLDGEKKYILDLAEDNTVDVQGTIGITQIQIKSGRVRITHSPCNTQFCVRSGWQKYNGEFTACLPNGVSVHLVGGKRVYDAINF